MVQRQPDGSVTLTPDEVQDLREVLHYLQRMSRGFAGAQALDVYRKLVAIRKGLESDFFGP